MLRITIGTSFKEIRWQNDLHIGFYFLERAQENDIIKNAPHLAKQKIKTSSCSCRDSPASELPPLSTQLYMVLSQSCSMDLVSKKGRRRKKINLQHVTTLRGVEGTLSEHHTQETAINTSLLCVVSKGP